MSDTIYDWFLADDPANIGWPTGGGGATVAAGAPVGHVAPAGTNVVIGELHRLSTAGTLFVGDGDGAQYTSGGANFNKEGATAFGPGGFTLTNGLSILAATTGDWLIIYRISK